MNKSFAGIMPRRILIVEDEEDLVKLLAYHLGKEGYQVHCVGSGPEALGYAYEYLPDLIILDIMLPEMDGLEVCRRLRSLDKTALIPIIILSARKEELDKVLGLELGADDYMVKPFSVRELVSRVRVILRRLNQLTAAQHTENEDAKESILCIGDILLFPERHKVIVRGEPCELTHKEFALLHCLMVNAGKVLTRDVLLTRVWGYEADFDTRTVDVHIRYLRQKVEPEATKPYYIETVRGVGYRFTGH